MLSVICSYTYCVRVNSHRVSRIRDNIFCNNLNRFINKSSNFKLKMTDQFVQMPWEDSTNIIYCKDGEQLVVKRWDLIQEQLSNHIKNVDTLIDIIKSYNVDFSPDGKQLQCHWKLPVLQQLINEMTEAQKEDFFRLDGVLHSIQNLVITMPGVCPKIPWLVSGKEDNLKLHQMQVACILANAFFCTFPKRFNRNNHPSINFNGLFDGGGNRGRNRHLEKLKCLVHYFWRIHEKQPCGYVTFHRRFFEPIQYPRWGRTTVPLSELSANSEGLIEDQSGHLQADFANRILGGGVLTAGCVQEEIRFTICPELIASRLFTYPMNDTEAVIIIGAERFCNYTGYADAFQFAGNHIDLTPFDSQQRHATHILCVDALKFRQSVDQYREGCLLRELKKIYAGVRPMSSNSKHRPFATGNWGCGVYRGDPQFKSLIQLMACSQAGRNMAYFTFGDEKLKHDLTHVHTKLKEKSITVGQLYRILVRYIKDRRKNQTVFQFVLKSLELDLHSSPFHNVAAETEELNEGGQKRAITPSSSSSSSHQENKHSKRASEIDRSQCPHSIIERDGSANDLELSKEFSNLKRIGSAPGSSKCENSESIDYIPPHMFEDDVFANDSHNSQVSEDDFVPCTPEYDTNNRQLTSVLEELDNDSSDSRSEIGLKAIEAFKPPTDCHKLGQNTSSNTKKKFSQTSLDIFFKK